MSDNKLGKGLSAIFGENIDDILEDIQQGKVEGINDTMMIDVKKIKPNPYQPRKEFDKAALEELAQSIKVHGIFTPILVKESVKGYELIAGERRLRASKLAGLKEIPAIVVEFNDQQMMEISLLENIQREDLNVIEEAIAFSNLIDKLGYTQEQLAKQVGKSREHVTNLLRLLKLPAKVQEYVIDKKLTMGHARALLALDDKEDILLVAKQTIKDKLSVRAVEKLIKDMKSPYVKKKNTDTHNTAYDGVIKTIQDKLQTKVVVDDSQLIIKYKGTDDLNRILELLGLLEEE
ncbi:ParB family chromosome partitioning protein [Breznakia sp. PF5-3]|uniref:ParB/RepB/Spo0J family partition protein n=1 Tax=unclassified Breznakia TaxID=2623764 RepID=UPI002405B355|nr:MULTISPECIES: ParB/RepB/Spo0J family partition protein [unclassified Breznakia]MDF9825678.1 ParB family chromosome partitioning protein [Breznakia sp. PM6-1]MDF9836511.1 ParB family chromosome partitioning protein [Breznakia sp. PF5-3]MDF9837814.1 ParB family chromosome partitioning protein [Breznakia sp. PFB2-8]MDF9859734.1 ParB family chromosome partitioning protein [Breznakia sp. PH5-24]